MVRLGLIPPGRPLDATVRPPGSKSETNRALVCAALAAGRSTLSDVLLADDTMAMVDCLSGLGVPIRVEESSADTTDGFPAVDNGRIVVDGVDGRVLPTSEAIDARLSGTTARFIAPVASLAARTVRLTGAPGLVARPMSDLIVALRSLGVRVVETGRPGHLPLQISSSDRSGIAITGGAITLRGDVSSQFLSGLLLAGPCMSEGLRVDLSTELVSEPYVALTIDVMRRFGAEVEGGSADGFTVAPTGYRSAELSIEADASAASYLMAAPLFAGGRIRVNGIGTETRQGDAVFADLLASMGAQVTQGAGWTEVAAARTLRAIDVDLRDASDLAQSIAVVASIADGTSRVRGIGFIRAKETDRIAATVTELRRVGISAEETDDGFTVEGGRPHGAVVRTYGDHRMAMSFALLGLRSTGVVIEDPQCVEKTFPGYFGVLAGLSGDTAAQLDP